MRFEIALTVLAAAFYAYIPSAHAQLGPGFNSETWPGRMDTARLRPLTEQLQKAMRNRDEAGIAAAIDGLIKGLGKYAGVPEDRPEYGKPIDTSTPDADKVQALWFRSFERMKGRNGWDIARQVKAPGQWPRLRVSLRSARAYLHSYNAGLEHRKEFLDCALNGFDYILSAQASNGVFGYPYDPNATEGLKVQAARIVRQGEARGIKMTESGWVIDDLEDGGLQFDNGTCGIGLLYAYLITGDRKYVDAARRAAEWSIQRPLVLNWNYNGFSGWLLARLYRVTGESKYLDAAVVKFKYGVLPGQMRNGRWLDQHNAKIQYHSVMMRDLIDFYLALTKGKNPYADTVRGRIQIGLDSLAEQILSYGASNTAELLSLDALCLGLMTFGPHENWEKAANVNVNFLCDHFLPELEKHNVPMTETVASYLLYRRFKEGKAHSCEIEMEKCLAQHKAPGAAR